MPAQLPIIDSPPAAQPSPRLPRWLKRNVPKGNANHFTAKLLEELQDLPRVGYIRTPNSVGYDLHYARHAPAEDGGDRIVIATDRYISFWEAYYRPRTIDYPFTFIEIHLNKDGEGEGKMSLATKVMADKETNQIVLENYASQPVLLQAVRAQRASQ